MVHPVVWAVTCEAVRERIPKVAQVVRTQGEDAAVLIAANVFQEYVHIQGCAGCLQEFEDEVEIQEALDE